MDTRGWSDIRYKRPRRPRRAHLRGSRLADHRRPRRRPQHRVHRRVLHWPQPRR